MINLQTVVMIVLYIMIAGAVFGLLFWLVGYIASQFPGEPMQMFAKLARIILIVLAVLVVIAILLSFVSGSPIIGWGGPVNIH